VAGWQSGASVALQGRRVVLKTQPKLGEAWSFTGWFQAPLAVGTQGGVLLQTRARDCPAMVDKDHYLGNWTAGKRFESSGFNAGKLARGWHHLAVVGRGGRTYFYVDGLRVGSSGAKPKGAVWVIGNSVHGKQRFSSGLDELRLHRRALTQVEVKWMMELSSSKGRKTGYVLREVWENVAGERVAQLTGSDRFARPADRQERLGALETASSAAVRYGARIRGFLVPKQSGPYRFQVVADDSAELWLSTGPDRGRKMLLASAAAGTAGPGEKGRASSRPVALTAGDRYYFEVLHKQGEGQGRLAVGWKRPDGKSEAAVPGEYLEPKLPGASEDGGSEVLLREASNANNQADLVVSVNKDPLRVLLVDSHPRWESRYLMTMLERDRRVHLVRRYRAVRVPRGQLELLPETQAELDRYCMVIFGDLKPAELRSGDQKRLADFVSRRGGFVVVLAGPRGLPAKYSLGGMADLLPVKTAAGGGQGGAKTSAANVPVRLRLTDDGERHTVTSVLEDAALNRKLWPALPGLTWVSRGVTAKAGAVVLLKSDDPQGTPVVAISRFGAGRVLYLGTDESWRWRDRLGDRIHQAFWLQAVRWGLGLRLRGRDNRLQVALGRSMITPDDETELRARATGKDGKPLKVKMLVRVQQLTDKGQPGAGDSRTLEMTPVSGGAGIQQLRIAGLGEGRWRLEVIAEHPELKDLAETRELLVQRQPGREGIELGSSPATLNRMARIGGHVAGDFSEARGVVESLLAGLKPRRTREVRTYSLWDNYVVLCLAVGLLLVEWIWRKRQGLP